MRSFIAFTILAVALIAIAAGPAATQDSPQRKKGFGPGFGVIPGGQVTPHWMADDTKFWYRKTLKGGGKEFRNSFGASCPRRIPTDDQGRMQADVLERALAEGSGPAIVCAQAGNVNTGSFDPIAQIAEMVALKSPCE